MGEELKRTGKKDIIEGGANVPILGNRCYRCGHEWRPRNMRVPSRVCPNCKSPYWDKPRRNARLMRKASTNIQEGHKIVGESS